MMVLQVIFKFFKCIFTISTNPFQVGDLLNFLSAVFFGVHILRTEHISRSTSRENFLPLLGYEVVYLILSELCTCLGLIYSIKSKVVGSLPTSFYAGMRCCSVFNHLVFCWWLVWFHPRM